MGYGLVMLGLATQRALAQTYLTNGEAFDYDVGDVFHKRYWQIVNFLPSPPVTEIDTVISETWTADLDSVRYVFSEWRYQPASGPGLPVSLTHAYETLWVTDLGSAATHYSLSTPCPPVLDTLVSDSLHCGRSAWIQFVAGDTCFEWDSWISTFIEGCGGPFIHSYAYWTFTEQSHTLEYFRKGMDECGYPMSIPMSIVEPAEVTDGFGIKVTSYNDVLLVRSDLNTAVSARITDAMGRLIANPILHPGITSVSVAGWSQGIYVLNTQTATGQVRIKLRVSMN